MRFFRLLNLLVICSLVVAAAYVYKIKFDSTVQAEKLAKLRSEIRRERDAIANLRAEWSTLDSPARIEALAQRHLKLSRTDGTQFDQFDKLPDRPPSLVPLDSADPIGDYLENFEDDPDFTTGSVPGPVTR